MTELYIGIMSGTSLDGADAVLADFACARPVQLAHRHRSYSTALRDTLQGLCVTGRNEIHRSQQAAIELAHLYAAVIGDTLEAAGVSAAEVQAVGCHGQTIRHMPEQGYTVQLNAPALLAELTGIRVVADFRSRDVAAGGQGAPLVPAFHAAMFADATHIRAVLNLGGMSNVTLLEPGQPVRGFDCGPANVLMDGWIERILGEKYDKDGTWAASGVVDKQMLTRMMAHPFFALRPPKSCGREQFNLAWVMTQLSPDVPPENVQATLAELTAQSVAHALKAAGCRPDELAVCGGGAFNLHLLRCLSAATGVTASSTSGWGIAPDAVEAMAFAWLSRCTLSGRPGNVPEVTGAAGARILGAIWPAS
ncbi:MAG: anhydro-N-acetylmuramic acid kinase [Methyloversatilis sp.]|nr:anhydro-N-acetylmuramic acid kinase [Methyloversatilis sp.]MBP6193180.1 anhydro-N-acetylmuramic acid kinase [Methyloversatilis sp.]